YLCHGQSRGAPHDRGPAAGRRKDLSRRVGDSLEKRWTRKSGNLAGPRGRGGPAAKARPQSRSRTDATRDLGGAAACSRAGASQYIALAGTSCRNIDSREEIFG